MCYFIDDDKEEEEETKRKAPIFAEPGRKNLCFEMITTTTIFSSKNRIRVIKIILKLKFKQVTAEETKAKPELPESIVSWQRQQRDESREQVQSACVCVVGNKSKSIAKERRGRRRRRKKNDNDEL